MQILVGDLSGLGELEHYVSMSLRENNSNSLFIDPDYPSNVGLIRNNWPSVIDMAERLHIFVSESNGGILFKRIPQNETLASFLEARSV